jgi:hypothetical protein
MSEPINPSLVDRVERSLRRRLNSDVRPHLLRYAARAGDVDSFMSSAARLIADTHEREVWLASWTPSRRRRQYESDSDHDTTAPDSTSPAPLAGVPPGGLSLGGAVTEQVIQALAFEIGPMARRVVETEVRQSHSVSELLYRLQAHIDDETHRRRFVAAATSALSR